MNTLRNTNLGICLGFFLFGSTLWTLSYFAEYAHTGLIKNDSDGMNYWVYVWYQSYPKVCGAIFLFGLIGLIRSKKWRYVYWSAAILIALVIWTIAKEPENKIVLLKTDYHFGVSVSDIEHYLLANSFRKEVKKAEFDADGRVKRSDYYPFAFTRYDKMNRLEEYVTIQYAFEKPESDGRDKMPQQRLVGNLAVWYEIPDSLSRVDADVAYQKLKSLFGAYSRQLETEFHTKPAVRYPYYRTYSYGGGLGKNSGLVIENRQDMATFQYFGFENGISSSSSIMLHGNPNKDVGRLRNDGEKIVIDAHQMFLLLEISKNDTRY